MCRHRTGRSARRPSSPGHPGKPFSGFTRLELGAGIAVALFLFLVQPDAGAEPEVLGAWVQLVVTGVMAAFGWLADKAVTVALVVWHAMQIVGIAIVRFAIGIGQILSKVYSLFASFWSNVLRPFISFVWRNIDRLQTWLKNTFGPALKFLEMLRRRVLDIYEKYFRPVLDTIDIARRSLQLLATFRVEWARELDRKLAELQDAILWPIREAMLRLNQAMDWINRIITLDGLFQRLTLLRSVWRDIRIIDDMWRNVFSKPLTPLERQAPGERLVRSEPVQISRELGSYLTGGDPPRAKVIDELAAGIRLTLTGAL